MPWKFTLSVTLLAPVCRLIFALSFLSDGNPLFRRHSLYYEARQVRIHEGYEASLSLYQRLLQMYPNDVTTATRMAASQKSQKQLECIFEMDGTKDRQDIWTKELSTWREIFKHANFTAHSIAKRLLSKEGGYTSSKKDVRRYLSPEYTQAPIYVTPAEAGEHVTYPWTSACDQEVNALDVLIALFLIGLAVPVSLLQQVFGKLGLDPVDVFGINSNSNRILARCEVDPTLVYSIVSILPIDLSRPFSSCEQCTVWIATDWHPRTLSLTKIRSPTSPPALVVTTLPTVTITAACPSRQEDAVMYIGPDSLALVQYFVDWNTDSNLEDVNGDVYSNHYTSQRTRRRNGLLLDVCTGSGIQAVCALTSSALGPLLRRAVCMDVNPRALRFVQANAILNHLEDRIEPIWGDLLSNNRVYAALPKTTLGAKSPNMLSSFHKDSEESLSDWLSNRWGQFDLITANPPFLPVPIALKHRHGAFSDGGASGEEILAAAVRIASHLLSPGGVFVAVSECFWDDRDTAAPMSLVHRIQNWWKESNSRVATGFLFTNEFPLSVEEYATRRSATRIEYDLWCAHLLDVGIETASPGVLYVRTSKEHHPLKGIGIDQLELCHQRVPKSIYGSIWTPSNHYAIDFIRKCIQKHAEKAK